MCEEVILEIFTPEIIYKFVCLEWASAPHRPSTSKVPIDKEAEFCELDSPDRGNSGLVISPSHVSVHCRTRRLCFARANRMYA